MFISKLELNNFRNYNKLAINFTDGLNIIIGDNAQGKTNILESIYMLAITKSMRFGLEEDIIRKGCDFCNIKGKIRVMDIPKDLKINISKLDKKIYLNNTLINRTIDYLTNLNVIMFTPDDLDIIKGKPQVRRVLLNIELSQLYKEYAVYYNEYNKILKTRNELLKNLSSNVENNNIYFEIVTNELIERAIKIYIYRNNFINNINQRIDKIYGDITNFKGLNIKYTNNIDLEKYEYDCIKKTLNMYYKNNYYKEIQYKTTLFGPHRDDFLFYLNNVDLRKFGSQGQQRLAIISFKLSEIELFSKERDIPVLLLDDIFSEIDIDKRNKLLKYINNGIQSIITTTDIKNINKKYIKNAKLFLINRGNIEKVE